MQSNLSSVTKDALEIWKAGVEGVDASLTCYRAISYEPPYVIINDEDYLLAKDSRIIVVGAGKAAAKMVEGTLKALDHLGLGSRILGWVNAPNDLSTSASCDNRIRVFPARSMGSNLPTAAAVEGTQQIVRLLQQARPHDLVICLISGGGSSLLVDPIDGLSLAQKIQITESLSYAGANIHQLNTVRRSISKVKGGGLLRACKAEQMVTLIISDVLNDDLSTIASGPTNPAAAVRPDQTLAIMNDLLGAEHDLTKVVKQALSLAIPASRSNEKNDIRSSLQILANNATAVDAAGIKAVELGYRYVMYCNRESEGDVEDVAIKMSQNLALLMKQTQIDCEIAGGEPTVNMQKLLETGVRPGRGGRNQHVVLATALKLLHDQDAWGNKEFCILSGGTDGEDGNSGAAGAWIDLERLQQLNAMKTWATEACRRFDSASVFERLGSSINSGLTGTNVCDLRLMLVRH